MKSVHVDKKVEINSLIIIQIVIQVITMPGNKKLVELYNSKWEAQTSRKAMKYCIKIEADLEKQIENGNRDPYFVFNTDKCRDADVGRKTISLLKKEGFCVKRISTEYKSHTYRIRLNRLLSAYSSGASSSSS